MKTIRVGFAVFAATLVLLLAGGTPQAFHSGGVAECAGCHSIHFPKAGGSYLLVAKDPSSTCLTCHEHEGDTGPSSYHVSTASSQVTGTQVPLQRTPGGDFGWVKKTYNYAYGGTSYVEDGQTHGHNVVAQDFGYVQDTENTTSPGGGSYPAGQLSCTSCHDPHGQYRRLSSGVISKTGGLIMASGSYNTAASEPSGADAVGVYRLLAGAGYTTGGVTFLGVPAAKAPSTYNQTEATNQVKVAYGYATTGGHTSWGGWCSTCHPNMHSAGHYTHPVDVGMSGNTINNYNSYVKSGDAASGTPATSFTSLVPFVTNSSDYTALAPLAGNASATYAGPQSGDQVTCLSCHRAHASGMMYGLRYDIEYEFMTKGG
jgi:hypothetical protein